MSAVAARIARPSITFDDPEATAQPEALSDDFGESSDAFGDDDSLAPPPTSVLLPPAASGAAGPPGDGAEPTMPLLASSAGGELPGVPGGAPVPVGGVPPSEALLSSPEP